MASYSISITINGYPCLNPLSLWRECRRLGLDTSLWERRANSYWNPRGTEPGRGWFLLQRKHVSHLDPDGFIEVRFCFGDDSITIPYLYLSGHMELLGNGLSSLGDASPCLVEVVDRRLHFRNSALGDTGHYNIRKRVFHEGVPYHDGSLQVDWPTLFQRVWSVWATGVPVPATPSFPYSTPPENIWEGEGTTPEDNLNRLLQILNWDVVYDPTTDTFTIVDLANYQYIDGKDLLSWLTENQSRILYGYQGTLGKVNKPRYLDVQFPAYYGHAGLEYDLNVTGGMTAPGMLFGMTQVVRKDLDLYGDPGTSLKVASTYPYVKTEDEDHTPDTYTQAEAFAAQMASRLASRLSISRNFLFRLMGLFPVLPGSEVEEVRWADYGGRHGLYTELRNLSPPDVQPPAKKVPLRISNFTSRREPQTLFPTPGPLPLLSRPVPFAFPRNLHLVYLSAPEKCPVKNAGAYDIPYVLPGKVARPYGETSHGEIYNSPEYALWDNCWFFFADIPMDSPIIWGSGEYHLARLHGTISALDPGTGQFVKRPLFVGTVQQRIIRFEMTDSLNCGSHAQAKVVGDPDELEVIVYDECQQFSKMATASGDTGAYGWAYWNPITARWVILDMQVPGDFWGRLTADLTRSQAGQTVEVLPGGVLNGYNVFGSNFGNQINAGNPLAQGGGYWFSGHQDDRVFCHWDVRNAKYWIMAVEPNNKEYQELEVVTDVDFASQSVTTKTIQLPPWTEIS